MRRQCPNKLYNEMFLNWIRYRIQWRYDVWSILFIVFYEYLKGENNLVLLLQYLNKEGTLCITRGLLIKFHWIFMSKTLNGVVFGIGIACKFLFSFKLKSKSLVLKVEFYQIFMLGKDLKQGNFYNFNPTLGSCLMPCLHS
jgi:hypothetical protein